MSTIEEYRGMSIQSIARRLEDGSGRASEVLICGEIEGDTLEGLFALKRTFATEQTARDSAMATGRQIVDKKIVELEIGAVVEEQTRLPSTHRHSFRESF